MKQVIVHPERCVGCMQCMPACAVAHSKSQALPAAVFERPQPKPRIHVGAGTWNQGFPNRCRHCDPAPCQAACLTGAIYRRAATATVMINPDRCINCASCAMACPYGVIRFHEDPLALPGRVIAVKCDNCSARTAQGRIPACVASCKSGALTYEEMSVAMKRHTDAVARTVSTDDPHPALPAGVALQRAMHKAQLSLSRPSQGGTHV
ncbi:MAG: 4Fe-4S binding protein [Desulfatitalea sp.]|nr:4Fe-4S binding protein [Desulfatitalea sp.]